MRSGFWYTALAALTALAVALLGGALVESARAGVWLGVGAAFAVQVSAFWLLFVALFPHRQVLAHGLGMLGRFLMVPLMALVVVPVVHAPAAPTLFAMVAVLFVTTLAEPVVLKIASKTRR